MRRGSLHIAALVFIAVFVAGCQNILPKGNADEKSASEHILADVASIEPPPAPKVDPKVPSGIYRSESSQDILEASPDGICIRRGKSTWSRLPNDPTGRVLFDRDDLARSWPQRLRLLDNGKVEHTKDAKPPFPEQKLVFVPDEGGQP